ncbi:Response regulator receiver domain-containing protein [Loktanella fryxellensis]|uniref:Response regulator receiver domain-containing protein n=1 Tax=Loktanella fryxellensis TaxID=245187 RepID=A0A1H7Z350_9RHOB|nr:Response regulator receiver domain-containing protein [Loktanella fryxellensis]
MARRVLLIEDEPNIIEAISFILSRDGFTVHTHQDGATAMAKVRAQRPDMIVLDVMLPGRSGYDILRDLRADAATADLPVLMLTARGQAKDRALAADLGADAFMTKPFSNAAICAEVRRLLAVRHDGAAATATVASGTGAVAAAPAIPPCNAGVVRDA